MGRLFKYSLAAIAIIFAAGCSQKEILGGEEIVIETPEYGYIFFDTEISNRTKGALINPDGPDDIPLEKNFGVIGYTYVANEWTTAEVQAKPNVFSTHNLLVEWDENTGTHNYVNTNAEPFVPWLGKQKYAFFAYYPYNNSNVVTSAANFEGNPYIDFTLPSRSDVSNHIDVLTAQVIDTDYSTRTVSFRMQHKLTALDIIANNLYTEGERVVIKNLTVELDNLLYDNVRIPLNGRDEPELVYYAGMAASKTANYPLLSNAGISVDENNKNITAPNDKTIIIIPQNQKINGTDYTVKGNVIVGYSVDGVDKGTNTIPFSINRDLLSGHRYYILLNFSKGDINIVIIESDMWGDKEINYEFE